MMEENNKKAWSPVMAFKFYPLTDAYNLVYLSIIDWVDGPGEKPELCHISPNGLTNDPLKATALYITINVEGWMSFMNDIVELRTVGEIVNTELIKEQLIKNYSIKQDRILFHNSTKKFVSNGRQ